MTSAAEASALTLPFEALSAGDLPRVGGKGANLGALTQAGIPVPPGFCVTTAAYDQFLRALPAADAHFAALDALDGADVEATRRAAEALRAALHLLPMPPGVAEAVSAAHQTLGAHHPLAVRSSATAEDLPGASFAGQQDTYLNIRGEAALLDAVRRCWISLFTDRAVLYRARGGFGHRGVKLAVVVQRLIDPEVSGILFTADPISGHRGIVSIDAGFGLGEALVGGLISADLYRFDRRTRAVVEARVGDKTLAIRATEGGGTREEALPEAQRGARALTDAQVEALATLGERIEAHYGGVPQDIEWCISGGAVSIVQARPITSLYPLPPPRAEAGPLKVYVSFGHVQMMTEAMPRLAREVWRLLLPVEKDGRITPEDPTRLSPAIVEAGSRLFIDVTGALRVPRLRTALLAILGHIYEEAARAVSVLAQRPEVRGHPQPLWAVLPGVLRVVAPILRRIPPLLLWRDTHERARAAQAGFEATWREAAARIDGERTPGGRIRAGARAVHGLFSQLRPHVAGVPAGIIAHRLLHRVAAGRWAEGVQEDVDRLLRGLPGNVTTEMDLAVGDLGDLVRAHPALTDLLRTAAWPEVVARAPALPGGPAFLSALGAFLDVYGERGAGEIDLSRPRWRDNPALLVRVIVGGLSAREAGGHRRRHAAQVVEGEDALGRLVEAAGAGPLGPLLAWWVGRLGHAARRGLGLREHPKFAIVRLMGRLRREVVGAGCLLVERGQLGEEADVWHLGWEELAGALDDGTIDLRAEAAQRRLVFERDRALHPPLVMSSEGEAPILAIDRADLPAGALAGTAASKGVVEGRARVVRDPERETLEAGEILVAPFTDPGWTPLFVHAAGVVTEVGGLMTHGAVVAREYGIPAVVSVRGATTLLQTGQLIRVDGTRGFVAILPEPDAPPSGSAPPAG